MGQLTCNDVAQEVTSTNWAGIGSETAREAWLTFWDTSWKGQNIQSLWGNKTARRYINANDAGNEKPADIPEV